MADECDVDLNPEQSRVRAHPWAVRLWSEFQVGFSFSSPVQRLPENVLRPHPHQASTCIIGNRLNVGFRRLVASRAIPRI